MNTCGNHSQKGYGQTGLFDWEQFDSLPRELRDALNYCEFSFATDNMVDALAAGLTPSQLLGCMKSTVAKKKAADLILVWGIAP
jgi:hypothetical protein